MRRINPWAGASTLTAFAVVLVTMSVCMAFAKSQSPRFSNGTVIVYSADMTGDGLRNAVIAYPIDGIGGQVRITAMPERSQHYDDAEPIVILSGREPGDRFGESVAILNDINGNGYLDIIIGAPHAGEDQRGEVYVFFGPLIPFEGEDRLLLDANHADITLVSRYCDDIEFGIAVAPLHNVFGDDRQGMRVLSKCGLCEASAQGRGAGKQITQVFIGSATPGYPNGGEFAFTLLTDPKKFLFWSIPAGDVLRDHAVTTADVHRLLQNYGIASPYLTRYDGDLNSDGIVNEADLEIVLNHLGNFVMRIDWSNPKPDGGPTLSNGVGPWPEIVYQ